VILFIKGDVSMRKEKILIGIEIPGLGNGTHEYAFSCTAGDFSDPELIEPAFNGEIGVHVSAEKTDTEIVIDLETVTMAELSCDLCLAPVHRKLVGRFRIVFVFDDAAAAAGEQNEEYRTIDRNTVTIDLTEDVRETLLLSLPVKVTCENYPDCLPTSERENGPESSSPEENSAWKDSLEKLKDKFH